MHLSPPTGTGAQNPGGLSDLVKTLLCGRISAVRPTLVSIMAQTPVRLAVVAVVVLIGGTVLLRLDENPRRTVREWPTGVGSDGRWTSASPDVPSLSTPPSTSALRSAEAPPLSPRALERRIRRLAARVATSPQDQGARSDLANALLIRARHSDDPFDLLLALEYLDAVPRRGSSQPELLYNRALVLAQLGLREPAREAWDHYLEVDSRSEWADAARFRQNELLKPSLQDQWEESGRDRLLRAARRGESDEVVDLLATFSSFARPWVEEELLPEWADAAARGSTTEAGRLLKTVTVLANGLAEATSDQTAARTIDRVIGSAGSSSTQVIQGLRAFGGAMRSYRSFQSQEETDALLAEAEQALRNARAPLWRWARFYQAVGMHRSNPTLAAEHLEELAAGISPRDQPVLLARVEWLLGTNEVTQNRYERSLDHYRRARELLVASDGPAAAAFLDLLIAEALSKLGDLHAAWSPRLSAIHGTSMVGDPQRLHAALYSAAEQLFAESHGDAAGPFVEALLQNARRWDAPPGLAEAAIQEGRLHAHRGRRDRAQVSFRNAWQSAALIANYDMRRRLEATIALYEAEAHLDPFHYTPLETLAHARDDMVALGYRFQLPRLDAVRAKLSLAAGDREAATTALRAAIDEEEQIRSNVQDLSLRASAFEGAQRAFDLLVELELDQPDGRARAFAWTERARSRVLLDLLDDDPSTNQGLARPVELDEVRLQLPHDTALVEYAVLPENLVAWLVLPDRTLLVQSRIPSRELEVLVERFRDAIEYGGDAAVVQEIGGQLWTLLAHPLLQGLSMPNLVIIPDRFLGRVPFAALYDSKRGEYLVEKHALTIAPSATAYLFARQHPSSSMTEPARSILAVGANHPHHPHLPMVTAEAVAVGSLYHDSTVLIGEEATRRNFLHALGNAEVIHFAGHGKDDPLALTRSRLFFWPAGAADDGILYSQELATRDLPRARLAVLAACRSLTPGLRGRENLSGLAAALLAAGVPTVVANLWEAEDQATGAVMKAFHQHVRDGVPPGEALRRAQLALLHSSTSRSEPHYWAGFLSVGAN